MEDRERQSAILIARRSLAVVLIAGAMTVAPADAQSAAPPTELFLRGHSVLPSPQRVMLEGAGAIELDGSWTYSADVEGARGALKALLGGFDELHGLRLRPASGRAPVIRLSIRANAVETGAAAGIQRQGYSLDIRQKRIEITGNSAAGLFYGVQTLLQILKPGRRGAPSAPLGRIEDWPAHDLRFLHWDTKHHQDRVETLKRYLDWSARFKVNMIGFELEDKFEYPSRPVIGAPGAFTAAELQELVDYARERYIQLVPVIQSPAHMAYVLKHADFSHLRADGNNYQSCLCDPKAYDLIFSMYDDVIRATKGVDYFFVSTDEVYYPESCELCGGPGTDRTRSLRWVDFVRRAHDFLSSRHRTMLAWVEYPFLSEHAGRLPKGLIDGVLDGSREEIKTEMDNGLKHIVYTSLQGTSPLFPEYFTTAQGKRGSLEGAADNINRASWAKPVGVFGAAWDDSGLHNEVFWLGWATVAQYGWNRAPALEQTTTDFVNAYYGAHTEGMVDVFRGLQEQTQFFARSWDRVVSRARGRPYGNHLAKGRGTRYDQTLPAPGLPALPKLEFARVYAGRQRESILAEARQRSLENAALRQRIYDNLGKADRNRYNLEVMLSVAEFTAHHNRLILGLRALEDSLEAARGAAKEGKPSEAVGHLVDAYDRGAALVAGRRAALRKLQLVWERSRLPKGQAVDGRQFVHVFDDTKDHWADRRPDLSYLVEPEESIGLDAWLERLTAIVREYAGLNKVAVRPLEEPRLDD